jgi:hypothetical protein
MNVTTALPLSDPRPAPTARTPRLSEEIFGFSWSDLVGRPIGGGAATLRLADYAEVEEFLARHRSALVAPESAASAFAQLEDGPAKARFCERAMDAFAVEDDHRRVGVFVGQAWDWGTYYLRYLAMLPSHRGHGAVAGVIEQFAAFLGRHGFERLEADVSVSHLDQLRRVVGCGFFPMGTLHSERWGALVHLVRFLSDRHEAVFLNQFSAGLRPPARREGRTESDT